MKKTRRSNIILRKRLKLNWLSINMMAFAVLLILPSLAGSQEQRLVIKDAANNTKLIITDEGKIGINTLSPQSSIDLGGGNLTVDGSDTTGYFPPGILNRGTGRLDFGWGGGGGGNMELYSKGHVDRAGQYKFIYGGGNFGSIIYTHYNGTVWTNKMTLDKDGKLMMGGGAYCTGTTWVNASSREYKQDIKELTAVDALNAFEGLKPVRFRYKEDTSEEYLGFIAEDVSDLIATKDRKGMSSMDIVALLTKVVQEQQKTIDKLTKKIDKLYEIK